MRTGAVAHHDQGQPATAGPCHISIGEVGAIMIVGGNIDHLTRVMTTAIALETSKGDLALALALGIVLVTISLSVNAAVMMLRLTTTRYAYA